MSSKLKILSVLLLATTLAGCGGGGTITGSIPGGNGGNNGGGDNGGGDNGGGDNGGGGDNSTTHNLTGRFLAFGKANTGSPDIENGTMVAVVEGQEADVTVADTTMPVPDRTLSWNATKNVYGISEDNFLDLDGSGENYTIGTYVTTDANKWYVGTAVGGEKTDPTQISADATYKGKMRAAVVPLDWSENVQPYEASGDLTLDLKVSGAGATVGGHINNVRVPDLIEGTALAGQITLHEASVTNGEYSGTLSSDLDGGTGSGKYDGAFYGSNAAETAGTLEITSGMISGQVLGAYKAIGSFGAKK